MDEVSEKIRDVKNKVEDMLKLHRLDDVKKKVTDSIIRPSSRFVRGKFRKVVTGDEKKRVRDLIKEKKANSQNVKLFDKVSFTLGILNIPLCQFFMLNRPHLFCTWFICAITIMMIGKYYYYKTLSMQYFLYDHCYYTNVLAILSIYLHGLMPWLFRMVFIFANGPVTAAIIVWRLSLVYHEFDRMVSIYIHIMPAALSLVLRWHIIPPDAIQQLSGFDYVTAAVGYIVWQALYYLKTEVWDREILDSNPKLQTSLRWLATDKKNPTARGVLKLLRKVGIMRLDEDYVPTEFKTKLVFMLSQFVYSCITFLPTALLYQSYSVHVTYIVVIFVVAVYNGASYYIDIFSKRYQLQFDKKEDMQRVVQAAAEIAYQAATSVRPSASSGSLAMSRASSGSLAPCSPVKSPRMPKTDSNNGLAAYADGSVDEGYAMGPASAAACSGASAVDDHTAPGGAFESIAEEASSDQTADGTEEAAQQQRVDDSIKDIIEVATKAFVDEWADQEYDSDNNSDHSGRDRLFSEETFAVAESDHKDIDGWAGDTNGEEGSVVSGGCECRSAGFADEDVVDEYTEKSKDA